MTIVLARIDDQITFDWYSSALDVLEARANAPIYSRRALSGSAEALKLWVETGLVAWLLAFLGPSHRHTCTSQPLIPRSNHFFGHPLYSPTTTLCYTTTITII